MTVEWIRAAVPSAAPLVAAALIAAAFTAACGGPRVGAAARDPMQCERNPDCAKGRGSYIDCTEQCADNPECVDRCHEAQVDRMGHP
jgi:hypothetical protein